MFLIRDIRESRVYQEAKEEGFKEGFEIGMQQIKQQEIEAGFKFAIVKMATKEMSAAEIAAILELDIEFVQQTLAAMSFQGHIENGVVVFDEPVSLPNGMVVRVQPVATTPEKADSSEPW